MKHANRLAAALLAVTMVFAMAATAFAQEVNVATGSGSITISNAAKGETYTIYKLFDASVTGTDNGSIAYTGTIPATLSDYFTKDTSGNISATDLAWKDPATKADMSDGLRSALKTWAATATATGSAKSDGSQLVFKNIPYGYYVVTTTQGQQAITVDSTNPTATIVDKNSSTPKNLVKTVNGTDWNIGDTVTYTISFQTSNYDGAGTAAKEILSYTIEDTLPDFLANVNVTSIVVDNDGDAQTTDDQVNLTAQFEDKKIVLNWYDEQNGKFLYDNGATVTITYTAVLTSKAAIDGDGNTNTVTLTWTPKDGTPGKLEDSETIYTYAIALKKVDDKGNALAGAKFELPFYVQATADTDGAYIYAGTAAGNGLTNQLVTPDSGVIVVKGVKPGTYSITEVTAPDGYNKLTEPVEVTAVKTGKTSTHTTIYLDENGNVTDQESSICVEVILENIAAAAVVIVNKAGAELPSTGGMGTTAFYFLGSILSLGAAVLLITKKRMAGR